MALAIRSAQTGKRKGQIIFWLILTMILGALFLGLKLRFEWYRDYVDGIVPGISWAYNGPHAPGVQMFMCFYFFMTGVHALHMVVGLGILTVLVIMTARNKFSPEYYTPLEISGLYWHFVDIVWIFLFALLYLIGGRY
jgi:cytochrome c oxidase subunit 3